MIVETQVFLKKYKETNLELPLLHEAYQTLISNPGYWEEVRKGKLFYFRLNGDSKSLFITDNDQSDGDICLVEDVYLSTTH